MPSAIILFKGPLLRQRLKERQEYEERMRPQREREAQARDDEARIQQRREYDARVQKWREYEARVQEGKEPVVYWIREKARAIASTLAKIKSDFSQISFDSPRHPTSFSVQSPLPLLYLSSRPSFQPESQTQSAPVEPNTEDQTRPTILKHSPQLSFATGILKGSIWRCQHVSGNPAPPGKRCSTREASSYLSALSRTPRGQPACSGSVLSSGVI
ncbi:hypothetical protein MMC22_001808 [Lobaria immixta]|nr:hypothetical protein [Lobaria immixta]